MNPGLDDTVALTFRSLTGARGIEDVLGLVGVVVLEVGRDGGKGEVVEGRGKRWRKGKLRLRRRDEGRGEMSVSAV